MVFLALLLIPLITGVVGFIFLEGITWKEFAVQVGAQVFVAGISAAIIYSSNTGDTEILNGVVTGKKQVRVSCSHSYRCHCHNVERCSGSGKNRSCSTHEECDTCYEHRNDWDWEVYSSIDRTFDIDRVDRRGSDEPPRWSAVQTGEPISVEHSYTNYVKAAPGSLFRHQGIQEKYAKFIPAYPKNIFDYYRLNRLVLVNGASVNAAAWNADLAALNGKLGARRQSNMVIVVAKNMADDYYYALEEAWIGGKKNDTILVIGVDGGLRPTWAVVMAWSLNKLFEVKLRDDIMGLKTLTKDGVINALDRNVSTYYHRKPMADFEYLTASITPTPMQWFISMLIGLVVAVGMTYLAHKHDFFDEGWRKTHFRKSPWHR